MYTFAFDAGQNGTGRPRAFVRLQTVNASATGYDAFAEYDVWHPDYAYAMAALGSSGEEMGMTLAVGGGTLGYPSKQSASGTTSSCSRLRTATRHRSLGSETISVTVW